jgi:hypothetical protein
LALAAAPLHATPDTNGQTGLVTMPDARIADEGVLDGGIAYGGPETNYFATFALFERLEATLQLALLEGNPLASGGRYRDKAMHLKFVVFEETDKLPQVAIGATDFHGTQVFPSQYVVASKRFGDLDLTLGYGTERIDGLFGGVRYTPSWAHGFGFVLEHDAHDYQRDRLGPLAVDPARHGGLAAGIEYHRRWWGVAATTESGELGARAWLRFDFGKPDWVRKTAEPAPPTRAERAPAPASDWRTDRDPVRALARALYAQDFDQVDVALDGGTLRLRLTNQRISLIGRAVGRAARTALLYGPSDLAALRITYTRDGVPVATYAFDDLATLRAYFAGRVASAALAPSVTVSYATPADAAAFEADALLLAEDREPGLAEVRDSFSVGRPEGNGSQWLAYERHEPNVSSLTVKPLILQGYFNDIDAAVRYDLFAGAVYTRELGQGYRLGAGLRLTLANNIDQASAFNTSALPHVRSDIALYRQEGPLKIDHLYLAKQGQLAERVYGRVSAGIYEEMFAGVGGQLLYLPAEGAWATDLTVEYARQRDYDGWGFLPYHSVTALGAFHYRFPSQGLRLTARVGRFLAGDTGLRFEARRRFASGLVAGAWYTITNGDDVTGPGSPGNPYHDKGIFVSVPFSLMLRHDTRARASMSLAPWSRDVGAMLRYPGDLYALIEDELLLDTDERNPLSQLGR